MYKYVVFKWQPHPKGLFGGKPTWVYKFKFRSKTKLPIDKLSLAIKRKHGNGTYKVNIYQDGVGFLEAKRLELEGWF